MSVEVTLHTDEEGQVFAPPAALKGGAPAEDPLGQAIARARAAATRGDVASALAAQEEVVALARQAGDSRDALVTLSVQLCNLAGYYQEAGRFEDAARALEEAVALDERTGHQDLESDRQALEEAQRRAAVPPEERERERAQAGPRAGTPALDAEALPPELREQLKAFDMRLPGLSPEQRPKLESAGQFVVQPLPAMRLWKRDNLQAAAPWHQVQSLADQARKGAIAALRGETDGELLSEELEMVAAWAADGKAPGSPWDELAGYLRAVAALLRGEAPPPVPAAYTGHMAVIQAERR